jgi:short-subunit dehydrogenase
MRPPLRGGTILVTGASSGIGREMARQLGPVAGALVLVARRQDRLEQLRAELQRARPELVVSVQPCDLGDLAAAAKMVEAARADQQRRLR